MNCSNTPESHDPCATCRNGVRRRGRPTVRAGMTLLEVILAIAILGGSLAVLGELVRVGTRTARAARVLTTAQLLAESMVAEITAGVTAADPIDGVIEEFGGFRWQYVVQIEQVDQQGLLAVAVTVREDKELSEKPVSYALVRWMIDPQTELDLETAAAEAAAATGSSGSPSSSGESSGSAADTGGSR
ncbi:MAG: prepilin-type N-terminal cleavage/methylation domain-containing protein [Pirellulaceae bacterium]